MICLKLLAQSAAAASMLFVDLLIGVDINLIGALIPLLPLPNVA